MIEEGTAAVSAETEVVMELVCHEISLNGSTCIVREYARRSREDNFQAGYERSTNCVGGIRERVADACVGWV